MWPHRYHSRTKPPGGMYAPASASRIPIRYQKRIYHPEVFPLVVSAGGLVIPLVVFGGKIGERLAEVGGRFR
jgi:hypothetical protein